MKIPRLLVLFLLPFLLGLASGDRAPEFAAKNQDGKVIRFYDDVDPDTHAQEVMGDIERNSSAGKAAAP